MVLLEPAVAEGQLTRSRLLSKAFAAGGKKWKLASCVIVIKVLQLEPIDMGIRTLPMALCAGGLLI